jgi:hypothetical protein
LPTRAILWLTIPTGHFLLMGHFLVEFQKMLKDFPSFFVDAYFGIYTIIRIFIYKFIFRHILL